MKMLSFALAGALLTTVASAAPFTSSTPAVGTVYVYDTTTTGGSGLQTFSVPSPPKGPYIASFRASFAPLGSVSAPETFTCALTKNNESFAQSTSTSVSNLGLNIGVSAQAPINVTSSTVIGVSCGTGDGANWVWGESLEVSLERVEGFTDRSLKTSQTGTSPSGFAH